MNYHIVHAMEDDLPVIYQLFEEAILFQKKNNYIGWNSYDKEFIQADIENGLLYKMIVNDQIICTFSICYSDDLIWRQREKGDAVYLHRIVLNQVFKGQKGFQKILHWAMQFAHERKLKYIRMDTWASNEKLISYYKSYGFSFIENHTTGDTDNLPSQHRNLKVALLELSVLTASDNKIVSMKTQRTIYIIGAGAIGKSLAVFLKNAGKKVVIIRGSVDDGSTQAEHIRVETADGVVHEADIEITTLSVFNMLDGIIVLANKSYGNGQLATALKPKAGCSPIVLLQNGLGVERPFMVDDFEEVYRCVLFVTSQLTGQASIRFKPVATCPIGIEKGNALTLTQIVQELSTPRFTFKSEEDIQQIIWKKAIVNSVFNSVCPLLEVDNGIFHRNKDALEIARRIISECTAIARDKDILISTEEVEESLLKISKSSEGQLISTLQDILNKRRTEINTLNFEVVRIAESLYKADSVKNTRLLGELIKLKADGHQRAG